MPCKWRSHVNKSHLTRTSKSTYAQYCRHRGGHHQNHTHRWVHAYEWVMSSKSTSQVNESCLTQTNESDYSQYCRQQGGHHENHTHRWIHAYEWVMSYIWMRESMSHTYKQVNLRAILQAARRTSSNVSRGDIRMCAGYTPQYMASRLSARARVCMYVCVWKKE